MIWTYHGAVKSSYQMDSPNWYFLHSYHLCPKISEKSLGQMDDRNEPKLCGDGS